MPAAGAGAGDTALRSLAGELAAPGATAPLGVYRFGAEDPGAELARHLERVVFLETFGNSAELLAKEYGPYEESSVFFCVLDHRRRLPAGVMRVLVPSEAGFKTIHDVEPVWGEPLGAMAARTGLDLDLARTWDIATLAVAPEYRGKATMGLVAMGLYQALALVTPPSGIEWLLAILDVPVLRMIRWKLRMPMAPFAGVGAQPYLGSAASLPVWCNVTDTERRIAATDPDIHALYFDGVGMEAAVRPLDLRSTLPAVVSGTGATAPSPAAPRRRASTAS